MTDHTTNASVFSHLPDAMEHAIKEAERALGVHGGRDE